MKLSSIVKSFRNLNILVVGDLMIDSYLWGKSSRISPEAPVPVVDIRDSEDRLGGAGNVALNLSNLGCKVFLSSVCGDDTLKPMILSLLKENEIVADHVVVDKSRPTTRKTRVISQGKHIIRFDSEERADISKEIESKILQEIHKIFDKHEIHAVIFQDYNKGMLVPSLIQSVVKLALDKNIVVSVDPKKKNFFEYKGVTLFKPNLLEVKEALDSEIAVTNEDLLVKACQEIMMKLHCGNILLTLSDKGVFYYSPDSVFELINAHHRNIVDVSGAGDTVISVATASMAVDGDIRNAALLSNLAGGLACEKVGVVPVSASELLDALKSENEEEIRLMV